jgi:hypothetical protein
MPFIGVNDVLIIRTLIREEAEKAKERVEDECEGLALKTMAGSSHWYRRPNCHHDGMRSPATLGEYCELHRTRPFR